MAADIASSLGSPFRPFSAANIVSLSLSLLFLSKVLKFQFWESQGASSLVYINLSLTLSLSLDKSKWEDFKVENN